MKHRAAPLVLLLAAFVACDEDDGREMRPPGSDKTTTTSTTTGMAAGATPSVPAGGSAPPATTVAPPAAPNSFSLVLPWPDGGTIPQRHTCDARRQEGPVFNWFVPPDGVAEFAVIVDDPDADGFVHWVAAGIPATIRTLDASNPPDGVVQAEHDAGGVGWFGPCPPEGDGPHQYRFTLHALSRPLGLAPRSPASDAIEAIEGASLATATYTGVYGR